MHGRFVACSRRPPFHSVRRGDTLSVPFVPLCMRTGVGLFFLSPVRSFIRYVEEIPSPLLSAPFVPLCLRTGEGLLSLSRVRSFIRYVEEIPSPLRLFRLLDFVRNLDAKYRVNPAIFRQDGQSPTDTSGNLTIGQKRF